MKTLLYIDIAIFVNENNKQMTSNTLRQQQIVNGLTKLFTYDFRSKECDILITDNTCNELPDNIKQVLPENIIVRCFNNNICGYLNKGTGLIQKWLYNKDIINNYDFIIHFEGRLELQSHIFFDNFFNNPRELFRFGDPDDTSNHTSFFTGLFTLRPSNLFDFCTKNQINNMIHHSISIENPMRDMFVSSVNMVDKLDLIWYPNNSHARYF